MVRSNIFLPLDLLAILFATLANVFVGAIPWDVGIPVHLRTFNCMSEARE